MHTWFLCIHTLSSEYLRSVDTFSSIQWFCERTAKARSDCASTQSDRVLGCPHMPHRHRSIIAWCGWIMNIGCCVYRIQSNYPTYPYKRTVEKFRRLQITASVLFLYFFIKAYVVGTHLNCIDLSMQFKWVPTTYAFINKIRKKTA